MTIVWKLFVFQDAQTAVTDKAGAYRDEAFKSRRLQEEIMSLKRKVLPLLLNNLN